MYGAIAGDVIGSVYEHHPIKRTNFELFDPGCRFTDDTVLSVAVADAVLSRRPYAEAIRDWGRRYPNAGYGQLFYRWLLDDAAPGYDSWGNGSAMRVAAIGHAFDSPREVMAQARATALVSHGHPDGIKGAQAVAVAVYLARRGASKNEIHGYLTSQFGYDLRRSLADIRPSYGFDVTCAGSVPEAIIAFLESDSFEGAVRNAISLGGDADTQACIAGAIAEAWYGGVPAPILERVRAMLPPDLRQTADAFHAAYIAPRTTTTSAGSILTPADLFDGDVTEATPFGPVGWRFKRATPHAVPELLHALRRRLPVEQVWPEAPNRPAVAQNLEMARAALLDVLERYRSHRGLAPLPAPADLDALIDQQLRHYCDPHWIYVSPAGLYTLSELGDGTVEVAQHDCAWEPRIDPPLGPERIRRYASIFAAESALLPQLSQVAASLRRLSHPRGDEAPRTAQCVAFGPHAERWLLLLDGEVHRVEARGREEGGDALRAFEREGRRLECCVNCRHFGQSGMARSMSHGMVGYCGLAGQAMDRARVALFDPASWAYRPTVGVADVCPKFAHRDT